MHTLSHCATAVCDVPADVALGFLADDTALGTWALGCWQAEPVRDGVVRGSSLFEGADAYVRVDPNGAGTGVDFSVGARPEELVHRISARVVAGGPLGYGENRCLVTLLAWRPAEMSDERWARVVASHEAEILLLRARLDEHAVSGGRG
jgi:hypothetical protein